MYVSLISWLCRYHYNIPLNYTGLLMSFHHHGLCFAMKFSESLSTLYQECCLTPRAATMCMLHNVASTDSTPGTEAVTASQPSTPFEECEKISCDCNQLMATESVTSTPADPLQPCT